VILALIGGGLGLLFAVWGVDALRRLGPANLPRLADITIDGWVLGFTFAVSCVAGLLFGLAPALQSARSNVHESLKEGGRGGATAGTHRQRIRGLLVVSEVALAMVLLVAAGLLIRSFTRLIEVHPGFDPHNVLTMQLSLPQSKYAKAPQVAAFYEQLLERIASLPGVEAAGATSGLPLSGSGQSSGSFTIQGRVPTKGDPAPHADQRIIAPDYFRAMKIPLLRGRYISISDGASAPQVVVIDDVLAKTYWPGQDPLGRKVTQSDPQKGPFQTVVGIVANVQHRALDVAPKGVMYYPHAQSAAANMMSLVVRTRGEPTTLAAAIRGEVQAIDPNQPVYEIKTMDQYLTESVAANRFSVQLLALFAGVALVLAAVGIYGVMSYSVTQKTHEIGIRMALGARQADVLREVVGKGMCLVLAGVGAGLVCAAIVTRLMSSLLFGVSATDPLTFAAVAIVLSAVAMFACYVPARRATRVDPVVALRYE